MIGRTKFALDKMDEFTDKWAKQIMKNDPGVKNEVKEKLDTIKIRSGHAILESLEHALMAYPVALDLDYKLITNKTKIPFISSDNPVVLHNEFLQDRKWPGGHTGIAQIGLQILVPLAPDCMIIFYDRSIYKVGNRNDNSILLTLEQDVHKLNQMQFINANKTIYFNEKATKQYIYQLSRETKPKRLSDKILLKEVGRIENSKELKTLLALNDPNKKIALRLSFIRYFKKSKQRTIGPSMYNVRSPEIVAAHEKYIEKINNEKKEFMKKTADNF